MASGVKAQYVALGALAVGGFKWLTRKILAVIKGVPTVEQLSLAHSDSIVSCFALQIVSGEAGSKEEVAARSSQYGDTGYGVFEEARRQSHIDARDANGKPLYTHEKNVLDDEAAHCKTTKLRPGCPELTEKGWVPIGTLPAPGSRACFSKCRCHFNFKKIAITKTVHAHTNAA